MITNLKALYFIANGDQSQDPSSKQSFRDLETPKIQIKFFNYYEGTYLIFGG